jgi:hypothetical protein
MSIASWLLHPAGCKLAARPVRGRQSDPAASRRRTGQHQQFITF